MRGDLRADVDPEVLVDQLWGACYHRLLLPGGPLAAQFTDQLVANLLAGAQAPPQPTPTRSWFRAARG